MKNKILKTIFSLVGFSIGIAVLGAMASIVTIFMDVNSMITIKWLLFVLLLFFWFVLILLKIIFDFSQELAPPSPFENPIDYVSDEGVFVIRRNENFINSIVVGCYIVQSEVERLAYLGVVHLVQDKVIQIKIKYDCKILDAIPQTPSALGEILVKPVVPITALQAFINQENSNE